jgi:phage terminase Nu1 subunit (DNA packaging protein)
MSTLRILYSPENLSELFSVDLKTIKLWTRLGILPVAAGHKPTAYDQKDIDRWIAEGGLERHKTRKDRGAVGFYGVERHGRKSS